MDINCLREKVRNNKQIINFKMMETNDSFTERPLWPFDLEASEWKNLYSKN